MRERRRPGRSALRWWLWVRDGGRSARNSMRRRVTVPRRHGVASLRRVVHPLCCRARPVPARLQGAIDWLHVAAVVVDVAPVDSLEARALHGVWLVPTLVSGWCFVLHSLIALRCVIRVCLEALFLYVWLLSSLDDGVSRPAFLPSFQVRAGVLAGLSFSFSLPVFPVPLMECGGSTAWRSLFERAPLGCSAPPLMVTGGIAAGGACGRHDACHGGCTATRT